LKAKRGKMKKVEKNLSEVLMFDQYEKPTNWGFLPNNFL